ncbi:protease synthase and sporulation negative regulatory protein PAI 1 [Commensalibacter intestini A911]|uniref:GNAT family acetyltransferase n=2 Tax=Commensalibacter intestini TaxID=479936 RepID=A0A251ZWZ2_9PROT|nr:GNAT family N-acetyltransferase [Commensalibacter intestini]EHD13825.1 protease synthase and sporulation negative regulatory protein PAI 1 [Commensalibacter intestini A911]OUI79185.1 GNAT family acetyltransferase [Commensalibacter intestini]
MTVIIERLEKQQLQILQQIARQSFYETFAEVNSKEDMDAYLMNNLSLEQLKKEMDEPLSAFYMAKLDQVYVGYLKVNLGHAQHEFKEDNALEIERVYVLQKFHRKKVGQALYAHAFSIAKEKEVDYVWLGVWEHNYKAMAFYKKNGFVPFSQHEFVLGTDHQIDILMKKVLKEDVKSGV